MSIKIQYDPAFNCIDVLIVAVSNFYQCNYQLMFRDTWDFQFDPSKKTDDNNLAECIGENFSDWSLLEKYHGLKLHWQDCLTPEENLGLVERKLKLGNPMIIEIDAFYCDWIKQNYKKIHEIHFVLAIRIDGKGIYCIDGYAPGEQVFRISYEDFLSGVSCCLLIDKINNESLDSIDMKELLISRLKHQLDGRNKNMFYNIKEFSMQLNNLFDAKDEFRGYEKGPSSSPIVKQILSIGNGRKKFAKMLEFISANNKISIREEIINKLINASNIWNMISGILIKSYYIKEPERYIKKAADKLSKLAEYEEQISLELLNNLENYEEEKLILSLETEEKRKSFCEVSYINIIDYFNNKGFGYEKKNARIPDFTGDGRFLIVNDIVKDSEWNIDELKFKIAKINNYDYDNVVCLGQVISIDNEDGNELMILGCSESGNHTDDIVIEYCDEKQEKITFGFTSWVEEVSRFNENIAWQGNCGVIIENEFNINSYDVRLYCDSFSLSRDKKIKNIILPFCPNIHIFALSLGKSI